MRTLLVGLALLVAVTSYPAAASARSPARVVDVVQVNGLIDPPTVSYVEARLAAAQASPSDEAVIVELDSQGGLVGSMSTMVKRILESEVPVVVWVAPRGAQAASAATLLVYAASLSYMAETTTLGAATPVNLNARESPHPVVGRTAALLRRLAGGGSRPPALLIRSGSSLTSSQAVHAGVIDGVASSLAELLQGMDGHTVKLADGKSVRLETWDQQNHRPSVGFRFEGMNVFGRLLHS
ncbi:MAG: hypothetical protein M3P18_08555, partial [Actinomycetota bacterium]|nr:hypothetical protein [Actinomycetota bacterium]